MSPLPQLMTALLTGTYFPIVFPQNRHGGYTTPLSLSRDLRFRVSWNDLLRARTPLSDRNGEQPDMPTWALKTQICALQTGYNFVEQWTSRCCSNVNLSG